jgi:hypothetical protein
MGISFPNHTLSCGNNIQANTQAIIAERVVMPKVSVKQLEELFIGKNPVIHFQTSIFVAQEDSIKPGSDVSGDLHFRKILLQSGGHEARRFSIFTDIPRRIGIVFMDAED